MLELKNVTMAYGEDDGPPVLDDISLRIEQGEVVLLCGESGCGKTSMLWMINGVARYFFQAQVSGEVLLNGENIAHQEASDIAQTVGSVFQNPKSQFFTLDVRSELAFGCENLGIQPDEIIDAWRTLSRTSAWDTLRKGASFSSPGVRSRKLLAHP